MRTVYPKLKHIFECRTAAGSRLPHLGAENAADDPFRREITGQGGIMLAVTHVVDPAAADGLARQITSAMREGRMLCGWVALRD